jgi:protoheme IX farnesyltransferase
MAVSFTAIVGYIIYNKNLDFQLLKLALSVFVLAGGASALNEYQERKYDAKMGRTMHRPIPSGKISPQYAVIIAVLFIVSGFISLFFFFGYITAFLGFFNVIWYNFLYTPLKKITAFAVVPGSLTGAVPVLMGWTAAGGFVFESGIVFIAFFLFIWQIPHFWLLMLKYGKEYEDAGFPTINQTMSSGNLKIIIFSWIIATSVSSLMVPFFIKNMSMVFFVSIFVLNIIFVGIFTKLSFGNYAEIDLKKSFISINIYMIIFMMLMSFYHLFAS